MPKNKLAFSEIDKAMARHDWKLRSIENLPECFVRDSIVTPYFYFADAPRRSFGDFIVEGSIGVIDGDFEKIWRESSSEARNQFANGLHIANFSELNEVRYLSPEAFADAIEEFCTAIVGILEQMPTSKAMLQDALARGKMAGHAFDSFSIFTQKSKHRAFNEYIEGIARR